MAESTRHREAFDAYWQLGKERTIEALRKALILRDGKAPSLRTLYEWSRAYQWQRRLENLERKARESDDQARITQVKEMTERHLKLALLLQQRATESLARMDADAFPAEAAIRAISESIRLERLLRGEPTQRTDLTGHLPQRLMEVSDAELDHLFEIAERCAVGDGVPPS